MIFSVVCGNGRNLEETISFRSPNHCKLIKKGSKVCSVFEGMYKCDIKERMLYIKYWYRTRA